MSEVTFSACGPPNFSAPSPPQIPSARANYDSPHLTPYDCSHWPHIMFDFEDSASEREKCFTTVAQLPTFVDPKQIPCRKSPFSAIVNHPLAHTIEIILPEKVYIEIQDSLGHKPENPRYARVFMYPSDLLEHDFFNAYIKTEGQSGSDTVFTLRDGICKIEMGKDIYERTGLNGKPICGGGRKHVKERFLVELNLRLPSMLHGKKGFERIVSAFKRVLNQSRAWLFCDLDPTSQPNDAKPIMKLQPQVLESSPLRTKLEAIHTPTLQDMVSSDMSETDLQDRCGALSEWIAMVQLGSACVSAGNEIDAYLSRYSVPDFTDKVTTDLICLKWHGLISSTWTMQLFLSLLSYTAKPMSPSAWFILSSSALDKQVVEGRDGFSLVVSPDMLQPAAAGANDRESSTLNGRQAICWEYVGATVIDTP
ncbi:hypothetical protein N7532_008185 [Penicillium argentinense]|uniref:Uncharacterized protein n=1 Tax=Penicillium argentinense TaxID=1131581 RepID=A0A9W9EX61_9EURO|nr:uncharacterized protein N7532_008185 [Penicillium argentinense]KAJ5089501.1 hypothetical protein N7532_008185 [Penicillium argentinense]